MSEEPVVAVSEEPVAAGTRRRDVAGSATGSDAVGRAVTDDHLAAAVGASVRGWIQESTASGRDRPTLVVAFSGGLDSCVLLHALRFGSPGFRLIAAHFDHRMRPASGDDASWVRGLCRAWDVLVEMGVRGEAGAAPSDDDRVHSETDDVPPGADAASPATDDLSEAEARRLRYDFLHGVRRRHAPSLLLTAHHADDQAETVLFRILRGTGIDGLSGIPAARAPGVVRPLLTVWREDLEAYARRHGLGWRDDPTNRDVGYARNLVRHRILPLAEEAMPGARRALVRLAEVAGEEKAAWSEALERLEASLDARTVSRPPAEADLAAAPTAPPAGETPAAKVSVDRDALVSLGPGLRARVLRHLVRRHLESTIPDREATGRAVDFAERGGSGRRIELGGGVEMARELDRIELRRILPPDSRPGREPDRELVIERVSPGEDGARTAGCGVVRLAGCAYRVRWEERPAEEGPLGGGSEEGGSAQGDPAQRGSAEPDGHRGAESSTVLLPLDDPAFPLRVRSRRPGDRMSTPAGTRKLKKILLEARVPAHRRDRLPVLVDAAGRVLWIPGVARAGQPAPLEGAPASSAARARGGAAPEIALRITIEPGDVDG